MRLLANIETATVKLLNLVLVGQPELADRLNEQSLRQLKQRITLRAQLAPLDLKETAAYVAGRLRIAGGVVNQIFTKQAVMAIYQISHGLPRIINVLSDNALMGGYAAQVKPVDTDIVREVGRDFDLSVTRPPIHNPEDGMVHLSVAPGPQRLGEAAPMNHALAPGDLPLGDGEGRSDRPLEAPRRKRFLFF